MVNDSKYFYLSGLISFIFFSLVAITFIYLIVIQDKIKTFALKKDSFISISLNNIDTSKIDTKKPVKKLKPKPTINKKPKEIKKIESKKLESELKTTPDVKKSPSLSNMFSQVKTKKITHKTKKPIKKIDTKRIASLTKRIHTTKTTSKSEANKKIEQLDLEEKITEVGGESVSRAPEVDEYLAKVHSFVYSNFHPSTQSANQMAKVRIWLSSSGKMSEFKILVSSPDALLNSEIDSLRQRLETMMFPIHPDNKATVIDIILKAKE